MSSASQRSHALLQTLFEQIEPETESNQEPNGLNGESVTQSATEERSINISALSLDSSDAQQLMHCYQLALNFGVPTARRALAMYQAGLVKPENQTE